ncbi:MAG: hypothetical protein GXP32_00500 [Kiritimatiellaeota bacterium]|nr:hypothetical protein [Kiritimatiellota bacterium]
MDNQIQILMFSAAGINMTGLLLVVSAFSIVAIGTMLSVVLPTTLKKCRFGTIFTRYDGFYSPFERNAISMGL